jgi:ERF superfamily
MNKSESITKLAPALAKLQAAIKPAQKSGDNKFDKYRYSKLEDFLDQCQGPLANHGFSLIMSNPIVAMLPDRVTKSGGSEHAVQVQVTATLIHESGEWIEVAGHGEGQDRADKAVYKALTGAKKYIVAGLLKIPTTDDPESDETVGQAAPPPKKVDSRGNIVTKKPEWSPEQQREVGIIRADIINEFGDVGDKAWIKLRGEHAYDQPSDVIDLAYTLLNTLRESKNNQ